MKKNLIIFVLLLFSHFLSGQDSIEVAVINEVLFSLPYTQGVEKIQLIQKTSSCSITDNYSVLKVSNDTLSESLFKEIILNRKSVSRLWTSDEINNVKLLNYEDVNEIQKSNNNSTKERDNSFIYYLALPIFNDKKDCSIIEIAYGTARNRMEGGFFLLKKIKGNWTIIKKISGYAT